MGLCYWRRYQGNEGTGPTVILQSAEHTLGSGLGFREPVEEERGQDCYSQWAGEEAEAERQVEAKAQPTELVPSPVYHSLLFCMEEKQGLSLFPFVDKK